MPIGIAGPLSEAQFPLLWKVNPNEQRGVDFMAAKGKTIKVHDEKIAKMVFVSISLVCKQGCKERAQ